MAASGQVGREGGPAGFSSAVEKPAAAQLEEICDLAAPCYLLQLRLCDCEIVCYPGLKMDICDLAAPWLLLAPNLCSAVEKPARYCHFLSKKFHWKKVGNQAFFVSDSVGGNL